MVNQLLQYWTGLRRGGRLLPPIGALDPQRIPVPWHDCCLVWLGDNQGPRFDHVGGLFVDECEQDLTGRPVASTPTDSLLGVCIEWIDTVLRHTAPVAFNGVLARAGGAPVQCRGIVLPFADSDGAAHYLLGTVGLHSCPPATPLGIQAHVIGPKMSETGEPVAPAA